jgi:magnesium chelatase family protein
MLAHRFSSILPPMRKEEILETTRIYSAMGLLKPDQTRMDTRPFRSPHHTTSAAAIVGGGSSPRPGEVTLSHNGVLFLDELPEFNRDVLEALRQPLEDHYVTISRASRTLQFPAQFVLIGAMNPCLCGYFMSSNKPCSCSGPQVRKYFSKISGPLLDRIDLHVEVFPLSHPDLFENTLAESSASIRNRTVKAREIQSERFRDKNITDNERMSPKDIKQFCALCKDGKQLLKSAITELGLSARAYDKVLKVARTIADLAESERIQSEHLAEAIQYRSLDRMARG